MRECFVLLAFGTPFDVVFHPFGHGGPPGDSLGGVGGVKTHCLLRAAVRLMRDKDKGTEGG